MGASGSLLCIGLDPDPALMAIDDVAAFNIAIIEATSDLVCAYKPNVAFYEALGPERGYAALRQTLAAIPPHVITLADAKRGDVDEHRARVREGDLRRAGLRRLHSEPVRRLRLDAAVDRASGEGGVHPLPDVEPGRG